MNYTYRETEAFKLVEQYFNYLGKPQRAHKWFATPNPLLGDVSPITMIKLGREEKLLNFIKHALEGNQR